MTRETGVGDSLFFPSFSRSRSTKMTLITMNEKKKKNYAVIVPVISARAQEYSNKRSRAKKDIWTLKRERKRGCCYTTYCVKNGEVLSSKMPLLLLFSGR